MAFTQPLLLSTYSTVVKDSWKTSNVKKHIDTHPHSWSLSSSRQFRCLHKISRTYQWKKVQELSHEPEANKSHFAQAADIGKLLAIIRKSSATKQPPADIS